MGAVLHIGYCAAISSSCVPFRGSERALRSGRHPGPAGHPGAVVPWRDGPQRADRCVQRRAAAASAHRLRQFPIHRRAAAWHRAFFYSNQHRQQHELRAGHAHGRLLLERDRRLAATRGTLGSNGHSAQLPADFSSWARSRSAARRVRVARMWWANRSSPTTDSKRLSIRSMAAARSSISASSHAEG